MAPDAVLDFTEDRKQCAKVKYEKYMYMASKTIQSLIFLWYSQV